MIVRVSTSKSEGMILCLETLDSSVRVGSELLSEMKEFKHHTVLLINACKT